MLDDEGISGKTASVGQDNHAVITLCVSIDDIRLERGGALGGDVSWQIDPGGFTRIGLELNSIVNTWQGTPGNGDALLRGADTFYDRG